MKPQTAKDEKEIRRDRHDRKLKWRNRNRMKAKKKVDKWE
jgi:hypothetical protein